MRVQQRTSLCIVRDIGGFPLITVGNYFVVLFDPVVPAGMILTGRKIVTKVGILLPAGRRDASRRRVRQTYLTQSGRSAPPVTPGEAGWECSPSCQCGSWGNTPSDCKKTGWVMGNGVPRRNFTFWLLKLSLASRSNADECCGN